MIYKAARIKAIFQMNVSLREKFRFLLLDFRLRRRGLQSRKQEPKRREARNKHRNRGFALNEFHELDDETFKKMFRLDRFTFDDLADQLNPIIKRDAKQAENSSGQPISVCTRLAVTLRWLAGGSYIDLCFAWGLSKTSFYSERGVIWPTIEAIDKVLTMGVPLHDREALEELAEGFRINSNGILDGCIMAMDGLVVRTRCPYSWEVPNARDYRNRKCGFGFIVLAASDIRGKFIFGTAKHSGSTNDIIAWQDSALYEAIEEGLLPAEYFIIGDEAFTCTNQVLSPWPGRGIGTWKDSFNFWLSHSRPCIERAFWEVGQTLLAGSVTRQVKTIRSSLIELILE